MPRPYALAFENYRAVQSRAYDCLSGGDGVTLAVDFEMNHQMVPRRKSSAV
jgi:hypothetical protein